MEKRRSTKARKEEDDEDNTIWWWLVEKGIIPSFLCISVFALLVRVSVSLHPYSGAGNPPKYGDYEAQRHWMEITLNLPPKEWYRNSSTNDLSYWGLDYPPLTAYQSYVHGLFLRSFDPESVKLYTSRGYESYFGKLLMRWTVLSSDALVFFPAVLYFVFAYYSGRGGRKSDMAWHIAMILLNPCLILIDHGHFQYNCISLGLTVGAVAAILSNRDLLASVLFSLALNHKQDALKDIGSISLCWLEISMGMEGLLIVFYFDFTFSIYPSNKSYQSGVAALLSVSGSYCSHLLGRCLRRRNPLFEVFKLGCVVLGTFAIVWWPYIHSFHSISEVLSRLAPFERGIYEDYVANFWCTTSVLIKWKRLFTTPSLKVLSLAATISTCLPSMVRQVWSPSSQNFLYGLLNSALSFYLFSFQGM
ncbi:unnamed protein product [Ilex paraguariensis]|uniref:Alpha-1,3-glucosyltransferase n=1 Tax=Ilex paraguariensis TaxID=185542 RepID=A0ABC8THM1_9AQUA